MKKIMILCAILCAFSSMTVFSQKNDSLSESEVLRIVYANQVLNLQNAGVINPDRIYPGQKLSYIFKNGDSWTHLVVKGEIQETIVRNIKAMEKINGQVLPNQNGVTPPTPKQPVVEAKTNDPSIWIAAVALLILSVYVVSEITKGRRERKRKEAEASINSSDSQPVLLPLVEEGISDKDAPAYMQQVIERMGPHFRAVGETEKGKATTVGNKKVEVLYLNGITAMESLKDDVCFRRKVEFLGEEKEGKPSHAYFKQPCGNDTGVIADNDIVWIKDEVQSEELQKANQAIVNETQNVARVSVQESSIMPENLDVDALVSTAKNLMEGATTGEFSFLMEENKIDIYLKFNKVILPTNHVSHATNSGVLAEN